MKKICANEKRRLLLFAALICCVAVLPLSAQTWAPQASGNFGHFSAVQFVNEQTGWLCGSAGKILKTTNSGATWFTQGLSPGVDLADLYFVNENIGWATGLGGIIIKTADGGVSWGIQSVGTTGWLHSIRFVDAQTGWAAGLYGTVLKTTDGGATWVQLSSGTASTIEHIHFLDASVGWMVTDDGKILRTMDGGASWSQTTISPSNGLTSLQFLDANVGWVIGNNGMFSRTTDGGATWNDSPTGTSQQLNDIHFINADTGWAVGNAGTIKFTSNGGATWFSQISGTTENLRSVNFRAGRGHAVGLNNTILEYAEAHAVPIQLASFTATIAGARSVRVNWMTISEVNNFGFYLERSLDAHGNFAAVHSQVIPGHGTTNEPQVYSYVDSDVPQGRLYYRLRQLDLDGRTHYTEPISVDVLTDVAENQLPTAFSLEQNYPNPFNPTTKIEFNIARPGFVSLKVFNMLGEEVATMVNGELNQGTYSREFSAVGLSSGVYLYKLVAGDFVATKKFVLAK